MNVSRRSFLAAAGLALAAALSTVSAYGATRAEKLRAALDGRDRNYVFVTMHRGDWRHAPENSVDAIKGAIAMGADIVELDVALTKDGEYVLLHDGALDRVSNGKGKSKDLTLAEIRKFRLKGVDGKSVTDYEILTLKEALALTKGKILVNLDKFPRDPQGIAEYVRSLGMEKEVILKGIFMPDALKKKMKNQWAGIEDGTFYYMPIIWLNKADSSAAKAGVSAKKTAETAKKSVEMFEAWQAQKRMPGAYELCIPKEKPVEVLERLKAMQKDGGPRIWINTLWDSLCAGHTDERGFGGDPDGSWGWALDQGATMIQTDRPAELLKYLESKGRRNLDAAVAAAACKCRPCKCSPCKCK